MPVVDGGPVEVPDSNLRTVAVVREVLVVLIVFVSFPTVSVLFLIVLVLLLSLLILLLSAFVLLFIVFYTVSLCPQSNADTVP